MAKIRVGVIGVGNIGTMHATNIFQNKIEGMTLTAVCDVRQSRLDFFGDEFPGVLCYIDYHSMFESGNVDAVVIAVPHRLHAEIAMEALQAGLHVLLEKPIDVTVTEAKKLIEIAEHSGKKFAIMLNQRTNKLFQKAREIVQSGLLGELKRTVWIVTNWYRSQHYYDSGTWRATWAGEGGGVLLNQAPHNLDLWQWICGMPESVRGFCDVAKYHNIEVEDDVTIRTKYKNGATGVFITTTGEYPGTNRLEISGDKGKLVLEQAMLKWWKLSESEREVCFTAEASYPKIPLDYEEITVSEKETGHVGILQNFANAILFDEELLSPGADGICELTISNAAYLSEWTGNSEIFLPFDGEEFDRLLDERSGGRGMPEMVEEQKKMESAKDNHARWQVRW